MCQRQHSDQVLYLSSNFKRSVQSIVHIGLTVFPGKNALQGWLTRKFYIFHEDTSSCPYW